MSITERRLSRRLQANDLTAEMREVARRRRFELPRWTDGVDPNLRHAIRPPVEAAQGSWKKTPVCQNAADMGIEGGEREIT